ncbi:polyadenylate-binding protein 2 [Dyadobacter sp. LJ53]|nr:polyadenylate-binding protein 2 [Dyadobacter chenwenxiniae]MCF0049316.1 polyadenylate-binding protein 2 [Dyadobacter chenwenxiniae]
MDYQFTPDELSELTADLNKITIVGDRYSGQSAERVNK